MNVCLLNDSFPPVIDGVANVVMNYGRIMTEELGAKVLVGTPRYPDTDYDHYPYRVVAYPSLDTTGFISGYRTGNPLAMREIAEMKEFKPDIIHSHCPAASTIMARVLQNETDAPIVFTYHTKFDVDIARAVGEGFLKHETVKAMVSNISACDEVWVVSNGAGENLKNLGYTGEFKVMSNGVDFPQGRMPQEFVREVTGAYDLPEGVPVFLFVGRVMKYKGIPMILDAMKLLSDHGQDFRMVIIGGGADAEEMHQKVRDLGLTLDIVDENGKCGSMPGSDGSCGRVLFTGPVRDRDRLRAWNTRADLFLFPSVYDTNGIVVREAAACGLASVLIKGSCAAEGIEHARNGYLIEETAESMAVLLADVCTDFDNMHSVGQHAMDEIYISWETSTRQAYARYGELLKMQKDGTLVRRRRTASDVMLGAASIVAEGTRRVFDIPRNIYGGMIENVNELRAGFEELKEKLPEGVREFGDGAVGSMRELGENAGKTVRAGIKFVEQSVKEGLDLSIGRRDTPAIEKKEAPAIEKKEASASGKKADPE
ncbi:MAG: glycosyltransferase [Lachnospiraceae bacterium]|nr:glycosyltransferase [Lachnospiraceae bacterium]